MQKYYLQIPDNSIFEYTRNFSGEVVVICNDSGKSTIFGEHGVSVMLDGRSTTIGVRKEWLIPVEIIDTPLFKVMRE